MSIRRLWQQFEATWEKNRYSFRISTNSLWTRIKWRPSRNLPLSHWPSLKILYKCIVYKLYSVWTFSFAKICESMYCLQYLLFIHLLLYRFCYRYRYCNGPGQTNHSCALEPALRKTSRHLSMADQWQKRRQLRLRPLIRERRRHWSVEADQWQKRRQLLPPPRMGRLRQS